MKHALLIRIFALSALLAMRALGTDNSVPSEDRKVRVVCRYLQTYFDVSVTLKPFAADISPEAFLDAVARQTANRYNKEWIGYLNIVRWNADAQKYVLIERLTLRDSKAFLNKLEDGDVLRFNNPVCRF